MTDKRGLAVGIATYVLWGIIPVYTKSVKYVPAADFIGWRILWSLAFCLIVVVAVGGLEELFRTLRDRQRMTMLASSSVLIAVNWFIFMSAIIHNHVIEISLGYFINPLINVVLGVMFLREHLPTAGRIAVALAVAGVAILTWQAGTIPWVALGLAITFALYGLIRRSVPVDALTGFSIETLLLAPLAAAWLCIWGTVGVWPDLKTGALLMMAGPVTAIPLMMFAFAARRLLFSTLGLLQFIAPSMVFLLGVFVYREPLGWAKAAAFGLIWLGLGIYMADVIRRHGGDRWRQADRSAKPA
jgi:chloramphenicol-sensitive protein RarD